MFRDVSLAAGFEEWDAPILEQQELYKRKAGDEIVEQMYAFEVGFLAGPITRKCFLSAVLRSGLRWRWSMNPDDVLCAAAWLHTGACSLHVQHLFST